MDNDCIICGGYPPASGKPCACEGTGKSSVALQYTLERIFDLEKYSDENLTMYRSARDRADSLKDEVQRLNDHILELRVLVEAWKAIAIQQNKRADRNAEEMVAVAWVHGFDHRFKKDGFGPALVEWEHRDHWTDEFWMPLYMPKYIVEKMNEPT